MYENKAGKKGLKQWVHLYFIAYILVSQRITTIQSSSSMRLLTNTPILSLTSLNISCQHFGVVKTLLALRDRLKVFEQRLNFLKRCKKHQIFPNSISQSFSWKNLKSIFPLGILNCFHKDIKRYKCQSLRQTIIHLFDDIRRVKAEINNIKPTIKNLICSYKYTSIIDIFSKYCCEVKAMEKSQLQKKFEWLHRKQNGSHSRNSGNVEDISVPITEELKDRVTAIEVELNEDETSCLALGPGFALCPTIDEAFLNKVKMETAACAYCL